MGVKPCSQALRSVQSCLAAYNGCLNRCSRMQVGGGLENRICQTWCEGTYNDLENRWLESMPREYIASYKPTYIGTDGDTRPFKMTST